MAADRTKRLMADSWLEAIVSCVQPVDIILYTNGSDRVHV